MVEQELELSEYLSLPESACKAIILKKFTLAISAKTQLSPDTYLFKFKFADPSWIMGVPLCMHMNFISPELVQRPYTPVSPLN